MPIPIADPKRWFQKHNTEIAKVINEVIEKGNYVLGPQVLAFEKEFANWNGSRFAVGVGNGTDAILLSLMALNIADGDEVITSSHTSVATISAIVQSGATPVLIDIEEDSRCLNPELIEPALTSRTKAILPVHIYGYPAQMDVILTIATRHNLVVVEDCAQAHGAVFKNQKVGTFGHTGAFSFYPTKNIGVAGDAGIVVTNDESVAKNLFALREYGALSKRLVSDMHGINSRLDELHAAMLRVRLKYSSKDQHRRNDIAESYISGMARIGDLKIPVLPKDGLHAWHLFVVESMFRDLLSKYLLENGISAGLHYPIPVHQLPGYSKLVKIPGLLLQTENLYQNMLTIPLFPELTDEEIVCIVDRIKKWCPK